MRFIAFVCAAAAALAFGSAHADVAGSTPSAFLIEAEAEVAATPQEAWAALVQIERWWNDTHTYSGSAANLTLEPSPGGCWCEGWGDNYAVEHARVVLSMEHEGVRTLRAVGGLGPLQELGVSAVLTFTIASHASGANVSMTYRVAGDPSLGLDQLAPAVDMVLMEQFGRFVRFAGSGSPD